MNTGVIIETERLFLIPGITARDDEPFIQMLRNDGNFRDFCGLSLAKNIWQILEIRLFYIQKLIFRIIRSEII